MIARRAGALGVSGLVLLLSGCAIGNFLTGAPSSRSTTHANALLARRCSGCHLVPDPAAMSTAEWQASLERMKERMRLPASEWDSLAAMKSREARASH